MSFEVVPNDVLVDILLMLPMESLVSLACSSKYLYDFITEPFFTHMLLRRSINNPLIFFRYYSKKRYKQYYSLQKDDDSFNVGNDHEVEMPIDCPYGRCFNVLGSANGVICLSDDLYGGTDLIALWNPSIRKLFELPVPRISVESHGEMGVVVGFGCGFNGRGGLDYKVVRLAYIESTCPLVEVFSLQNRCWKSIRSQVPLFGIRHEMSSPVYSHCFMRNWCHWPCWKGNVWNGIVTFELSNEVFGFINLPKAIQGSRCCDYELKVCQFRLRHSIALMHIQHYSYEDSKRVLTNGFGVWVMKNYGVVDSWMCLYKVSNLPLEHPIPRTFFWRKDNKELLSMMGVSSKMQKERRHVLYSLLKENVKFGHVSGTPYGFHLCSYVESMSLFREGKYVADVKEKMEDDDPDAVVEYDGSDESNSEFEDEDEDEDDMFEDEDDMFEEEDEDLMEEEEEDGEVNENGGQD